MNEEMRHLVKLVKSMRSKQKEYFKTRDNLALSEARNLEIKVDSLIGDIESTELFSENECKSCHQQKPILVDGLCVVCRRE